MALSHAVVRRWTVEEFERMVRLGLLKPEEKVELVDGELVRLLPKQKLHAAVLAGVSRSLTAHLEPDYLVRQQLALDLGPFSQPRPDLAVVDRLMLEEKPFPRQPYLVVEVVNFCQSYHEKMKTSLYAAAGIPEAWFLNVEERGLDIYSHPEPACKSTHPFGARYGRVTRFTEWESVRAQFAAERPLSIHEWFPGV